MATKNISFVVVSIFAILAILAVLPGSIMGKSDINFPYFNHLTNVFIGQNYCDRCQAVCLSGARGSGCTNSICSSAPFFAWCKCIGGIPCDWGAFTP